MNPNAGEPGNQGGVAVADKQNPTPSTNPLDNLEGVVAAAKLEAGAVQPTAPIQALEETPKGQFENQFGSGPATPPVAEAAVSTDAKPAGAELPGLKQEDSKEAPVAQLDPSIKTVDDLLAKGPQVVENSNSRIEAVAPAEKTLAEKAEELKQEMAAKIDAFLEEVTKEKIAV